MRMCCRFFFLAYIFCFCWFVWNWSFDIKGMINIYLDSKKKSNQFDSGVDDRSSPCMCTTATTSTNLKRLEIINNWFWNYGVIFSNWLYCVCTDQFIFTNDRSSLTFFFFLKFLFDMRNYLIDFSKTIILTFCWWFVALLSFRSLLQLLFWI